MSRQHEEEYFAYYGYPYYWGGSGLWGGAMSPNLIAMSAARTSDSTPAVEQHGDPHLRSAREVSGYMIQARDGDLGHVADFVVDDASWTIRSIVVDTRNWWPGKHVLVAPESIVAVNWAHGVVSIDLEREQIKQKPVYEPSQLLNRAP
ncbi:MAG: PRC-barrel domain-containing protein [Roseiflexaceae bacterium]